MPKWKCCRLATPEFGVTAADVLARRIGKALFSKPPVARTSADPALIERERSIRQQLDRADEGVWVDRCGSCLWGTSLSRHGAVLLHRLWAARLALMDSTDRTGAFRG